MLPYTVFLVFKVMFNNIVNRHVVCCLSLRISVLYIILYAMLYDINKILSFCSCATIEHVISIHVIYIFLIFN